MRRKTICLIISFPLFSGLLQSTLRTPEMTSFRPRSSCSTIIDADAVCPTCQMCFDTSGRRKLVDTNCGHARCFRCTFQTNECPLCLENSPHRQLALPGCDVSLVNHHNKTQSLCGSGSVKLRHGKQPDLCMAQTTTAFMPGSLHSRESGFQSFASSMSSVCSRVQGIGLNNVDDDNDDDCISTVSAFDKRSVASGGSFISLMSCQSNLPFNPEFSGMNRNDFKRHSLSSFKRVRSDSGQNGIGGRNSVMRRSAIITRSSRMSSIEENRRKFYFLGGGNYN